MEDKWERVCALEREHVDLYTQLLRVLDELHLERSNSNHKVIIKDEQENLMKVRRQMQCGLEESAAILSPLQRANQMDKDGERSLEDLVAERLNSLMERHYSTETECMQIINARLDVSTKIFDEQKKFMKLREELQELDKLYGDQGLDAPAKPAKTAEQEQLERENETLRELLVALQVYSGSGVVI